MNWIDRRERVPDNRRAVLTWGRAAGPIGWVLREGKLLGVTRYNRAGDGNGTFDRDGADWTPGWGGYIVTHWCEIEGPTP